MDIQRRNITVGILRNMCCPQIGMDGEFNIARWKVDGALLNQRVCKIIAKDNADEEFLRFALSKALKAIEDRTSFATVKYLSAKELNKLEIPVPPYEEQKKISEILHRLEKGIDIRQNELASLDELIKARLSSSLVIRLMELQSILFIRLAMSLRQ
ncbi:restriction endonuclease subunit S [[Clostridium] aminophilum]|uniref:restriction endonuclease subunit S n=1 Tax=[Clostridium] aminophilum TaxID=1526 RepID=UPI0033260318